MAYLHFEGLLEVWQWWGQSHLRGDKVLEGKGHGHGRKGSPSGSHHMKLLGWHDPQHVLPVRPGGMGRNNCGEAVKILCFHSKNFKEELQY